MIKDKVEQTPEQFYRDNYNTMSQAVFLMLIVLYLIIKQPIQASEINIVLLGIKIYAIVLLLYSWTVIWRARYFSKDTE